LLRFEFQVKIVFKEC